MLRKVTPTSVSPSSPNLSREEILESLLHNQYSRERQRFLRETRQEAVLLKETIEKYGLSKGLIAYADTHGVLSELSSSASLENLSDDDLKNESDAIKTSLESYIDEITSLEKHFILRHKLAVSVLVGALTAVIPGILLYIVLSAIDEPDDVGAAYGSINDAEKSLTLLRACLSVSKKIVSFGPPNEKNLEEYLKKFSHIQYELSRIGIHLNLNDLDKSSFEIYEAVPEFKPVKFSESGLSVESFNHIVHEFDEVARVSKSFFENNSLVHSAFYSESYDLSDKDSHIKSILMTITHDITGVAERTIMELERFCKRNQKFFKKK